MSLSALEAAVFDKTSWGGVNVHCIRINPTQYVGLEKPTPSLPNHPSLRLNRYRQRTLVFYRH